MENEGKWKHPGRNVSAEKGQGSLCLVPAPMLESNGLSIVEMKPALIISFLALATALLSPESF